MSFTSEAASPGKRQPRARQSIADHPLTPSYTRSTPDATVSLWRRSCTLHARECLHPKAHEQRAPARIDPRKRLSLWPRDTLGISHPRAQSFSQPSGPAPLRGACALRFIRSLTAQAARANTNKEAPGLTGRNMLDTRAHYALERTYSATALRGRSSKFPPWTPPQIARPPVAASCDARARSVRYSPDGEPGGELAIH